MFTNDLHFYLVMLLFLGIFSVMISLYEGDWKRWQYLSWRIGGLTLMAIPFIYWIWRTTPIP